MIALESPTLEPPVVSVPAPKLPVPATGLKRVLFVSLGCFFVGMAYLGAILPGLPTTPWVLLASYFFSRSSPRLERWLKRSPFFGTLIRDWEEHRGMRRAVKVSATCIIVPVVTMSALFAPVPEWVRFCIAGMGCVGVAVIWLVVPTAPGRTDEPG
jgi:uncharacterized membrane protein YbaN (DUF454 family)